MINLPEPLPMPQEKFNETTYITTPKSSSLMETLMNSNNTKLRDINLTEEYLSSSLHIPSSQPSKMIT